MFFIKKNLKSVFCRSAERYAYIDGIRAIAILLLMCYHLIWFAAIYLEPSELTSIIHSRIIQWLFKADMGVDTFFVISGFLITTILLTEYKNTKKINVLQFYVKRFLRLMPIYYVSLLVVSYVSTGHPQSFLGDSKMMWTNLIYINNYVFPTHQFMAWSWSLSVEEQFYFIMPFLLILLWRFHARWMGLGMLSAIFLISFIITIVQLRIHAIYLPLPISPILQPQQWFQWFYEIYSPFYTRFGPLVCGVILAYVHCYYSNQMLAFFKQYQWVLPLAMMMALLLLCFIIAMPIYDARYFSGFFSTLYLSSYRNGYGIIISMLILSCLYSDHALCCWLKRFLSDKIWYPIAQLSYSAFLFHPLVIYFLYEGLKNKMVVTAKDIMLVPFEFFGVTLAVALLAYVFIEKPFMNLREAKFMQRKTISLEEG